MTHYDFPTRPIQTYRQAEWVTIYQRKAPFSADAELYKHRDNSHEKG